MSDDIFKPDSFFHETSLRVRFGDVDGLGHVNHAKYLTYMEHGRTRYFKDIFGWSGDMKHLPIILAKATVDFKVPLYFDEPIIVYTKVSRLGNKSFDMAYLIRRIKDGQPDAIVSTAITNMVAFDYESQQTMRVPDEWRTNIQKFEKSLAT